MLKNRHFKEIFGMTWHFLRNIFHMVFSIPFLVLTIIGNSAVFSFAIVFYNIEKDVNPKIYEMIDAVWWSFATATTVGYGDITPVTFSGKIIGIILMLTGTGLFATYTAFFARAILGEDFVIKPVNKHKPKLD